METSKKKRDKHRKSKRKRERGERLGKEEDEERRRARQTEVSEDAKPAEACSSPPEASAQVRARLASLSLPGRPA